MARPRRSATPIENRSPAASPSPGAVPEPVAPNTGSFAVSRSVQDMRGEELKVHARKVGISERDIQGLSEERLRQNCLVMIHEVLDSI